MENSNEQKFEILVQHLKNSQFNGGLKARKQPTLTPEKALGLAEELQTEERALCYQRDELLFAYQTLEIGYQRYWEFFNFAPDGYLVTDANGIIREANQTAVSILSTTQADLLDKSITTLIPEIQHQDFGMQLNWFAVSYKFEVLLQPRHSAPFYASISVSPQCDIHNRTIGLLWLIRDISERKKMEDDLQKSKTELSLILEQTPYILWTTDTDLNLTSFSGAGSATFKSPDSE
jgi:PAS domain S-box-containing protein